MYRDTDKESMTTRKHEEHCITVIRIIRQMYLIFGRKIQIIVRRDFPLLILAESLEELNEC